MRASAGLPPRRGRGAGPDQGHKDPGQSARVAGLLTLNVNVAAGLVQAACSALTRTQPITGRRRAHFQLSCPLSSLVDAPTGTHMGSPNRPVLHATAQAVAHRVDCPPRVASSIARFESLPPPLGLTSPLRASSEGLDIRSGAAGSVGMHVIANPFSVELRFGRLRCQSPSKARFHGQETLVIQTRLSRDPYQRLSRGSTVAPSTTGLGTGRSINLRRQAASHRPWACCGLTAGTRTRYP